MPSDPEEETLEALSDPKEETLEASSDPEETLEVPSDPEEETLEASSDTDEKMQEAPMNPEEPQKAPPKPEGETREASSDSGVEAKDVAGLAEGSTDLEGLVVPARQKLTVSDNLPPNDVIARVVDGCKQVSKEYRCKVFCRRRKEATRKVTRRVRQCATAGAR